jgi:hypothetical protein
MYVAEIRELKILKEKNHKGKNSEGGLVFVPEGQTVIGEGTALTLQPVELTGYSGKTGRKVFWIPLSQLRFYTIKVISPTGFLIYCILLKW